jgi:hypothetical protein
MKNKKNLKLVIGIGVILLVVLGVLAGYQLLQGPVDIRNRAAGGGACSQDTLPIINCTVYYKLTKDPGTPPAAQGKAYILNELGAKVHFNGGQDEQKINLPPGDHSTDGIVIPFENVVTNEYFLADKNEAKATCVLEKIEVPDECCKIPDGNGGTKISESCLGEGKDETSCTRTKTKIDGCVGKECSCEDILLGVTRYPTYHPRQPGIDDGKIILPTIDPAVGDVFCVNCSRVELIDKKTGKVVKTFPTVTPDPAKPGANACLNDNGKDIEKEAAIEFRCHQGDASGENGCREYDLEIENITKKLQCEDPADEPPPSEKKVCKIGCKTCCPVCTDPQPMWVERKLCTPKAGMPNPEKHPGDPSFWDCTVQKGETCSDKCNIDFSSPAIDNYNAPGFEGGNEIPPPGGPGRGYPNTDPKKKTPACIAAGQRTVLKPTIDPGSEGWIGWDEFDFGAGKPVPTEAVKNSNSNEYTDPGTYDISLVCKHSDTEVEVCTKRIAVTCNNDNPPPPPPPPGGGGGGGNPPACYDSCNPSASKCAAGMSCVDVSGGSGTAEYRCVQYPDNNCGDLPNGEKKACYCTAPTPTATPTPSPTPTPGACRAQVKASCAPLQ